MDRSKELIKKIKKFRDERDWKQFHNHKDLAISVVLEASELLENFQWKKEAALGEVAKRKKEALADEIGDIILYLFELSDNLGIDPIEAAEQKMIKNAAKYPVSKSKGSDKKYTEL